MLARGVSAKMGLVDDNVRVCHHPKGKGKF
jgi:hypothetical protein